MDLEMKINEIKPHQLNCNIFSVYDYEGLTIQELLCEFFTKINECINVTNETIDLAKWLVNEGLASEVVKKLVEWFNDGTLENLINGSLFEGLNTKIDKNIEGIDQLNDNILIHQKELEKFNNLGLVLPSGLDDTENILNAINNYNKVTLVNGEYNVKNIKIIKSVEITGDSNTVINCVGVEGNPTLYSYNVDNITIKNIKFNGNKKDMYGLGVITLINANNCLIDNCEFDNIFRGANKGTAAIDLEGVDSSIIRNNIITNSGYGIILGTRESNLTIMGESFSVVDHANNNVIENNYIDTTTMDGIFVTGSLNSQPTTRRIHGNYIINNIVKNSDDLGIESSRNSDNCIIENNKVYNSKGANIFVRGGDKNIIKNNYCFGAKGGVNSAYSGGIAVSQDYGNITNVIIDSNTCVDNIGEGISVGIVSNNSVTISNNLIQRNEIGINLLVNAKYCNIKNNTITDNKIGINTNAGSGNASHNRIKSNLIDNNRTGIVVRGERNIITFNEITNGNIGVDVTSETTTNFNQIHLNEIRDNTTNVQKGEVGTGNKIYKNLGSDNTVILATSPIYEVNEIYIDPSTNQLKWNKDGSYKTITFS